ncbi:WhiB family transcriptional regulator [Micromonospora musae]|uniref:WhiB family transcriptional regulator n=1 Tax=Micromonospora musae TaxID=1894970 RepID=UPI0033CD4A1D
MSTLVTALAVPTWHEDAACRDFLDDTMFPERGDNPAAREAKRICAACPVRSKCLNDALDRVDEHGIRGGLDPQERRAIRKRGDNPPPMGCAECHAPRTDHNGRDHDWQPPSMATIRDRVAAGRKLVAA